MTEGTSTPAVQNHLTSDSSVLSEQRATWSVAPGETGAGDKKVDNPFFQVRENCPACASARFRTFYRTPYNKPPIRDYLEAFYSPQGKFEPVFLEGASYALCECSECGLIFQKEIPGQTLSERLYDKWIDPDLALKAHLNEKGLERYSHIAQDVMQILAYFRQAPATLKTLDFGMGWGDWALMARAFGCDSYGSDISRHRMDFAQTSGVKILSWDEIAQHRFDCVNTEQVLEHLPDPLETVRYLGKSLRVGGILKISVPTAHDIKRRLRIMDWKSPKGAKDSLNPVAPLEHINLFSRKSLLEMGAKAGMHEVTIPILRQYKYSTQWGGVKRVAKNLIRPIYRDLLKRQNYVLLCNDSSPQEDSPR